jgi:hypothetical protein
VLVVAALGLVLASCGLPQDSAARPVASADVPSGLLSSTTTIDTAGEVGPILSLYFLDQDETHLVATPRRLTDLSAATLLSAVIGGPDPNSEPRDLRSDIPKSTRVVDLSNKGGTLTVVLSEDIIKVTGSAQANAFAQLVWSATQLPGVKAVQFLFDDAQGNRQAVKPLTDFGSDASVLSRRDYQKIKPPATTSTTQRLDPSSGSPSPEPSS